MQTGTLSPKVDDPLVAARHLLERQLPGPRAARQRADLALDLGERLRVGVADDRDDEALVSAHRDRHVDEVVVLELIAVDERKRKRRDRHTTRGQEPRTRNRAGGESHPAATAWR